MILGSLFILSLLFVIYGHKPLFIVWNINIKYMITTIIVRYRFLEMWNIISIPITQPQFFFFCKTRDFVLFSSSIHAHIKLFYIKFLCYVSFPNILDLSTIIINFS